MVVFIFKEIIIYRSLFIKNDDYLLMDAIIQSLIDLSPVDLQLLYAYHNTSDKQSIARILYTRSTMTEGEIKLYNGIVNNDIELVQQAISSGVEIDTIYYYSTPLMTAISNRNMPIIKYLVENGADVNYEHANLNPLNYSIDADDIDILKYLIENGADLNKNNKMPPLSTAVNRNNLPIVRYLIENGASVNLPNKYGKTPLQLALDNGYVDIVKYLIDNGANISGINIRNVSENIKSYILEKTRKQVEKNINGGKLGIHGLHHMVDNMCKQLQNYNNIDQLKTVADAFQIVYPITVGKDQLCSMITTKLLLKEKMNYPLRGEIDFYTDPDWIKFINKRAKVINMTRDIHRSISLDNTTVVSNVLLDLAQNRQLNYGDVLIINIGMRYYHYIYDSIHHGVLFLGTPVMATNLIMPYEICISKNIPSNYWTNTLINNIWLPCKWMEIFIENLVMIKSESYDFYLMDKFSDAFTTNAKIGDITYILEIYPEHEDKRRATTIVELRQKLGEYASGIRNMQVVFTPVRLPATPWVETIDCRAYFDDDGFQNVPPDY